MKQQAFIIMITKSHFMKQDEFQQEPSLKKQVKKLEKSQADQQRNHNRKMLKSRKLLKFNPIRPVNLKHIVNINDVWFINEQTLKDPEGSTQNIQRAMFRYKMISKIVLNNSFIELELKKVDDNYLPPQYFFQRFRSFGDRQIAAIANDLQSVYISFSQIKAVQKEETPKQKHHEAIQMLNQFLKEMQGKMYTIYFVEISAKSVNLKHIFFSVVLLQKLGWNIKRVAQDFLKYRHVFFEIFSPRYYKDYIQACLNNYFKAQQLEKDPSLTRQQKIQMGTIYFDDQVVRQVETEHGIYEEYLKAKVKFSCPHPSFCCVEVLEIDENPVERYVKKNKLHDDFEDTSAEEEINMLKRLGFDSLFLDLNPKKEAKDIVEELEQKEI